MELAAIQFAPQRGDLSATLDQLDPWLEKARGADLVVLPELANSGYDLGDREGALASAETLATPGAFLSRLQELSLRHRQAFVAGLCEREGARLYNSAVAIEGGKIKACYRKLHLFGTEKTLFDPGPRPPEVVELAGAKVGMLVCFDWCFPEVWRILALAGAEVVAHPSNLVLVGACQQAIPVHAMINRYFVVTANRVGEEGLLRFTGNSLIAGPRGRELARAGGAEPELLRATVDPARSRDKAITAQNHVLGDRRPEHYRRLVEDAGR